jgi:hypothetical protein
MLVKLYTLPPLAPAVEAQRAAGVTIRNAIPPEKHVVVDWTRRTFGDPWASECEVTFANKPVTCIVAIENERLVGISCYEATCKDFLGPIGVDPTFRGRRTGEALLLMSLHNLHAMGYAYAIIGGVGPAEFYARTVGATLIDDSVPGIYGGMLRAAPRPAAEGDAAGD